MASVSVQQYYCITAHLRIKQGTRLRHFKTSSLSNIKVDAVSPVINSISLPAAGVYTTVMILNLSSVIPGKFSLPQMIIRLFFPLASEIKQEMRCISPGPEAAS